MRPFGFTVSEERVAVLVSIGMTSGEIAQQLAVGEKTVKYHLTAIYKKTKINQFKDKRSRLKGLMKGRAMTAMIEFRKL